MFALLLLPAASRIRLPRQWRHRRPRRRLQGRRGRQDQPDKADKKERLVRPEPPGQREKKPSQGKTERPALPERLERPEPQVRLERLAKTDEKTGRAFKCLIWSGGKKKGKGHYLPFFISQNRSMNSICLESEVRFRNCLLISGNGNRRQTQLR
jgi:hypothetical protein